MHMLEQVQCRAAAAVKQLDMVGFQLQRRAALQPGDEGVDLGQPGVAQGMLGQQRLAQLTRMGTQVGVGIAQQVSDHPQGLRE
jgi:hypothetical protein